MGARGGPYYGPFLREPFDFAGAFSALVNRTNANIVLLGPGQIGPPEFFSASADLLLLGETLVPSWDSIFSGVAVRPCGGPWRAVGARGSYYGPFFRGPFDSVGVIGELNNLTGANIVRLGPGQIGPPKFSSCIRTHFLAE